jgi:hypothetical protein
MGKSYLIKKFLFPKKSWKSWIIPGKPGKPNNGLDIQILNPANGFSNSITRRIG